MPNWVCNHLTIKGENAVDVMRSVLTKNEESDYGYDFDFNKIIPMPEDLKIISGSITRTCAKLYLNAIAEDAPAYVKYAERYVKAFDKDYLLTEQEQIDKMNDALKYRDYPNNVLLFSNKADVYAYGKRVLDNVAEYGAKDWYDWSIKNWGSKWNAANTKPKIVIWENVAAVLNEKHIRTYRKFYNTLNSLGYKINAGILNAKYFNLPQNRVRIFVVAMRKDLEMSFSFPRGYDSGVRIKHVLQDKIPEKFFSKSLDDMVPYNKAFASTHRIMALGKIKNTKFKQTNEVLSIDGIFDCLTTKQGNYIVDDRTPRKKNIRHLTPNESLRLMGFEDKDFYKARYRYEKQGNKSVPLPNVPEGEIYVQAGNSIAVNVLMALFGEIYGVPWKEKVFKDRQKTDRDLLYELPLFAFMKDDAA